MPEQDSSAASAHASISDRLGIQIPIAVDGAYRDNADLREYLDAALTHRLSVVELNIVDYEAVQPAGLLQFLQDFNLRLQNLATGGMAVRRAHALAHPDSDRRADAIATIRRAIAFSAEAAAHSGQPTPGIILGLVQGKSDAPKEQQRALFASALEELLPAAADAGVALIVEATNRYLSGVSHTVEESVEFALQLDSPFIRVLPDTFHMNIEERDICAELIRHREFIDELHVSENNRFYPGFGALDFRHIGGCFEAAGFSGPYVIEGNLNTDVSSSLATAVAALTR